MAWALGDPDGTAALVIVSGATMPWPGGLSWLTHLNASWFGRFATVPLIAAFATPKMVGNAIDEIFVPAAQPPGYADYIGSGLTLRRLSFRTNARQVAGLKAALVAMAPRYSTLTLPVEIVHGELDTIVPAKVHAVPLAALLPNARLTLLPGAGHMPHHTHPAEVIAAIDRAAARAGLR